MGEKKKDISRRSFLKGSALGAIGLGVASAGVTGCASDESTLSKVVESSSKEAAAKDSVVVLNPQDYDYRSSTTDFTTLFSGLNIGSLALSHRLVKSAAGSDTHHNAKEIIEYHRNFAKGGIDLVWMEDSGDTFSHFPNARKKAMDEIPFKEIVEAVHAEGSYIGYQLSCMGFAFSGTQPDSSGTFGSAIASDLSMEELNLLQEDTIAAAKYLKEMGFDAVEYNAAGNNLGQAFFSRMRNMRDDEYGSQSFENRTRFVTEIIQGIKKECGDDFVVQVLINGIEENDEPLGDSSLCTTVEENKEIGKQLEAAGADSLHVRLGPIHMHVCQFASDLYFTGYGIDGATGMGGQYDFSRHWQGKLIGNHSGCGMMLDVAKEIKEAVSIPVGTVTYMDPAHAPDFFEEALKDGKADFLLMNRPLTVDTEYVNKLKEGRIDEIAPCTRCMHCHFDFDKEGEMYEHCRVNACTQRAFREEMPEGYELPIKSSDKDVMVIGGGPAGMEAARIAALRGYKVTLYEKNSSVGGLLEFANLAKGPHENLGDLRNYLERQLEVTGVTVVTEQEVDTAFITEQAPDVVILATGGLRDSLNLAETTGTKIVAMNDFLAGNFGDEVVIVGANAQAVDAALYLIAQGKHINMVFSEPLKEFNKNQSNWVKTFASSMLYKNGTRVWPNSEIVSVGDGEITISGMTGVDMTIPCDAIIEAMDMLPNTAIIEDLSGIETYAVGDCNEPWNIAEAITAGNLTARKV